MLAIVFWNARRKGVEPGVYAESLIGFHRALRLARPAGFRFSATYRVEPLPWFDPGTEIYEDYYLVSNFEAIDNLNGAVLRGQDMAAHRELMQRTGAANGAIFALSSGTARIEQLPVATWFIKPRNVSADELMKSASQQSPDLQCSLWTRSLALGPIENCLLSSDRIELPDHYLSVSVDRELVWHASMDKAS